MKNPILTLICAFLAIAPATMAGEKPNIVLILVDDLGYGDLGCYGAKQARTPNLDALMESGMRFDQFYANCTVCSPTRASLMTGLYPDKAGVPGVIRQWPNDSWGYLNPAASTLPQALKSGGYHTAMVGKWHLGFEDPNIPTSRGFDFFHGFLGDMMDDYWTHRRGGVNWMRRNTEEVAPEGHATEIFSQWATDYITERAADKTDTAPFFLYLAYNAPHFPIQPPEDWLKKVTAREPGLDIKRATNIAFVEHTDAEIGKVLDTIKTTGIDNNTLIIFSSDNGGSLPHGASNGALRGGKQDHWEGGIRVPTCAVWPGKIPVQRSNALGMTMDFLPTLCEIAGIKIEHPVDGQSLAPVWLRNEPGNPERPMVWVRREGNHRYQGRAYYAIRRGKWKLQQSSPFDPMQLVDLDADPLERNPMPAKGKVAEELTRLLMDHIQAAGQVPWQPRVKL
ncbi:MAG: sulfatase-like hydrolase/transferase [Verrucomicrobiae bacterium]|nr:sulfatase-like hydrolase/transferase [Verrucomicrobiae bacterium]